MRANLERDREKLAKAKGALDRTRERIREIEYKLSETTSDKWTGIFGEWLDEAQRKERNIEESMDRIESWIREDEDKLYS